MVFGMGGLCAQAQPSDGASVDKLVKTAVYVCQQNDRVVLANVPPPQSLQSPARCVVHEVSSVLTETPAVQGYPTPSAVNLSGGVNAYVSTAVQRQRDGTRAQILRAELRSAQLHLQALSGEYREGKPQRLPNETNRNYVARVMQLKQNIRLAQSNITALSRELYTAGSWGQYAQSAR